MNKEKLDELLNTLEAIAFLKSMLPFQLRGWVNALGLYVQQREAGQRTQLQAGGRLRNYLDVWREGKGGWQMRKFDKDTWESRFAHLVEPTYQIAHFLSDRVATFDDLDSDGASALDHTLQQYKDTGVWLKLPEAPKKTIDKLAKERAEARIKKEREKRLRRISENEMKIRNDSLDRLAWMSLSDLYLDEERYKDMENALRMNLKADAAKLGRQNPTAHMQLGETYLAALSVAIRGKGIAILSRVPSSVTSETSDYSIDELRELAKKNMKLTAETLGYTTNELHELTREHLSKAYEMYKKADNKTFLKELDLALKAVDILSVEAFEELDRYQEQEFRNNDIRHIMEQVYEEPDKYEEDEDRQEDL